MKITLSNTFHNTETCTTVDDDGMMIPKSRVRAIRRRLCGSSECVCGGDLGERGDWATPSIVADDGMLLEFNLDHTGGGRFERV